MTATAITALSAEHADFYARFQSFWAAPTGPRVAELIPPDAVNPFSGVGSFSGTEYNAVRAVMPGSTEGFTVPPL